jgi:iron complex transport system ATP-binding protein
MMDCILQLNNLQIGFHSRGKETLSLLPPVNMKLISGDFVALMGPNGAGKTTLLRTISGMHPSLGGSVFLHGKPIHTFSKAALSKFISIVLTDSISDYFLKVYDVVAMGRYPYTGFWGHLRQTDHDHIERSLQASGTKHLADRTLVGLSDGERQKVLIAKALAQDTPLIILDEPAAFLDYPSKIELMQLLQYLTSTEGKTIIFSTHDLELALHTADRIWLMARDNEIKEGIPEQLVVDGDIGRYFNRSGLVFDNMHGKFTKQTQTGLKIKLQGVGLNHKWLQYALLRKGYQLVNNEWAAIEIYASEKGFTYQQSDKDRIFTTKIEPILDELSKL